MAWRAILISSPEENRMNTKQQNYKTSNDRVDMKLESRDRMPSPTLIDPSGSIRGLGWRFDDDVISRSTAFRIVQFTPPGSAASVTFGKGITASTRPAPAESALVVSDIEVTHDDLIGCWHLTPVTCGTAPRSPVTHGNPAPIPSAPATGSFLSFNDPDGNTWIVQEVTTRSPALCLLLATEPLTTPIK